MRKGFETVPFEVQRSRSGTIQAAAEQLLMDIAKLEAEKAKKGRLNANRLVSGVPARSTLLVEFSSDQAPNRTTEFIEGIVPLIGPNGDRSSVPPREAVIAGRDNRSIRVSDFSGPTGSVADHGRIRIITLPAPDVEPVEPSRCEILIPSPSIPESTGDFETGKAGSIQPVGKSR